MAKLISVSKVLEGVVIKKLPIPPLTFNSLVINSHQVTPRDVPQHDVKEGLDVAQQHNLDTSASFRSGNPCI
jgi:hypothetical protein